MKLKEIKGTFSILKQPPKTKIPLWIYSSSLYSISCTDEELSIVCETSVIEGEHKDKEDNWRCLKVQGPLDFSLTGILSSIAFPLAEAKISIFAISTFDTDYIMVKSDKLEDAKTTLKQAGFEID